LIGVKIVDVRAYPLAAPRPGVSPDKPDHYLPYWKELSAAGVRSNYYSCIVEIKTDEDVVGYGESLVREVPEAHALIVDKLFKKILLGQDPTSVEELWEIMFASLKTRGHFAGYFVEALSGVDIALWDIVGKLRSAPVYKLLGGPTSDKIKAYASSIYWHYLAKNAPEGAAKEAKKLVETGHNQIKIKIGMGKLGAAKGADIGIIKAVRDEVGPDVDLMVDANSAYNLDEAIDLGKSLERYEVLWFEEPLPPYEWENYIKLAKTLDIQVAGGESLFSRYTYRDFITKGGLDIVQPDVSRCGGITEFMKIAELCKTFGVNLAPHTGLSGLGSRAAALQVSAAVPRDTFVSYEYMYKRDNPLVNELATDPIEKFEGGYVQLPEGPGLGIKLNPKSLRKFTVR
jgi:D-arabinonate dehydratase/D-galactarolactone cycloisomerase